MHVIPLPPFFRRPPHTPYQVSGGCEQHSNTLQSCTSTCRGCAWTRRGGRGRPMAAWRIHTYNRLLFLLTTISMRCRADNLTHQRCSTPTSRFPPPSLLWPKFSKRRRIALGTCLSLPSFPDLYHQLVTDQHDDHLHLCPHPSLCRGRGPRSALVLPRPSAALLRTVASSTWGLVRHPPTIHSTLQLVQQHVSTPSYSSRAAQ
jgi:hypothetical protein